MRRLCEILDSILNFIWTYTKIIVIFFVAWLIENAVKNPPMAKVVLFILVIWFIWSSI